MSIGNLNQDTLDDLQNVFERFVATACRRFSYLQLSEVEDCAQQVWLKICKTKTAEKIASMDRLHRTRYVRAMLNNELIDSCRRMHRNVSLTGLESELNSGNEEHEKQVEAASLEAVLSELDSDELKLIDMLFYRNQTRSEAAAALGVSRQYVGRQIQRTLEKLNRLWQKNRS